MSIVTKTGDKGETSLLKGDRVRKNDPRINAYGTVDELNATIGVALSDIENPDAERVLGIVQHHLFRIGAELAAPRTAKNVPRITHEHVDFLDEEVKKSEERLTPQQEFIVPKGTASATHLHLARTICRRAERTVITCSEQQPVNPDLITYLNRLGDLIYLFARIENAGNEETVDYDI